MKQIVYRTILRCQRERQRRSPQGEREPVLERQRLERREPASRRGSRNSAFLLCLVQGSFLFFIL